ncbi:3-keto-5-aminohexanoate cleavage protein [Actinoalloteichus spitiensis]|uniref:3-keto-5-aminohexanoate cleavage protein n=1 Tax=Actinoalloteichus spitiensis TaxID=252394 RepID=UPI00037C5D0E|nr:3-keto-5-aminohexanoate cleavage protein [Actinoalloteichus spitiensis]
MASPTARPPKPGTIITVAPTGSVHRPAEVPNLPVSLDELVATARNCEQIGASRVHVHVRDPRGEPSLDLGRLIDTVSALRQETTLVVQLATGAVGSTDEDERLRVLEAMPDMASCPLGSVNVGDHVLANRWPFVVECHRRMRDRDIVPEYEAYDLGHLTALRRLLVEHGPPAGRVHVNLVMGLPGGMPGDADTVVAAARLLPPGASLSVMGLGRVGLPVMLAGLAVGGHLRVGMQGTLSYAAGERVRDNAQLVARAAGLARIAQRPPLSPTAAREFLGVRAVDGG